jgi:hypothetical protein
MLYVPGPKVLWTVAVPNAVPDVIIHALPMIAESSQYVALALQNNTCPVIVPAVVEVTVAVSVTAVSGATVLGVTFRVVPVAEGCAQAAVAALRTSTTINRARIVEKAPNAFIDSLSSKLKIQWQATIYTLINYHCGAPPELECLFSVQVPKTRLLLSDFARPNCDIRGIAKRGIGTKPYGLRHGFDTNKVLLSMP